MEPRDARVRRAEDREAVDELVGHRLRVLGAILQVHVAVVATTHLGDDGAIRVVEPCAGRTGHRREVRERGHAAAHELARGRDVGMARDRHVGAERDIIRTPSGHVGGTARQADTPREPFCTSTECERDAFDGAR